MTDRIYGSLRNLGDWTKKAELTDHDCPTCVANWSPFFELESQISFLNPKTHPLRRPTDLDLKCVHAAQSTYSGGGGYADCGSTRGDIKKGQARPCVSESYVELTTRAFNLVAACTKAPKRDVFALFTQESGFHLNAFSHTGAGGIGQLTKTAILGVQQIDRTFVTTTEIKTVSTTIQHTIKNHAGCAPLREYEELMFSPLQAARRCEILSFPRNPLLPLLTSVKHYLYGKTQLKGFLGQTDLSKKFSAAQIEEIETEVAQYAYNGGVSGVGSSFLVYARTAAARKTSNLETYLIGFQKHLAANFSEKKSRNEEISNHVRGNRKDRGVKNRLKVMDEKGGGACFAD